MTHPEIHSREIAEAYARGQLSEPERAAFEDHYFACDQCFEEVETLQKFVEGVRTAAEQGTLPAVQEAPDQEMTPRFFRFGFFVACGATLLLAVAIGWILLIERPRLEAELARLRFAQAEPKQIAVISTPPGLASQPNQPLVMLEASRADTASSVAIPATAQQLVIWVEPPPAPSGVTWRLEILTQAGAAVESVNGLVRNSYRALTASVPAAPLTPGSYRARLLVNKGDKLELVGDYRFEVRK